MNRLEKFGLITGIIGLISDTIALVTFFAGFWGSPTSTAVAVPATTEAQGTIFTFTGYEIPLVVRTVLILTLIYSWAAISWVLVRRSFRLRKHRTPEIIMDIMFRAVCGIGILVLPIFVMWTITLWQSGLPTRIEADKVYSEFKSRNAAGRMCAPDFVSGSDCIWDQSDASFWAVPASLLFQVVFIGVLCLMFFLLFPVVYPDMAAEEIAQELGLLPSEVPSTSEVVSETFAKVIPMRNQAKVK